MGVRSSRLRVSDLAFQVYGRALHPDWFAVRAHRRVHQTGWEADVRLVEGGHVVVWGSGDSRVSEVLIGAEAGLPAAGLLHHSRVRHERVIDLHPSQRVQYQTCHEVERLDAELFAHLNDELMLEPLRGGLCHRFSASNRLAPSALSLVHLESRPRGLSIQAYHTFPDERAIVRTQSLFELCGEKTKSAS
jgi:hypothetical protein